MVFQRDIFWVISRCGSYSGHEMTKRLMSCFHEDFSRGCVSPAGCLGKEMERRDETELEGECQE